MMILSPKACLPRSPMPVGMMPVFTAMVTDGLKRRDQIRDRFLGCIQGKKRERILMKRFLRPATWTATNEAVYAEKAKEVGVLSY